MTADIYIRHHVSTRANPGQVLRSKSQVTFQGHIEGKRAKVVGASSSEGFTSYCYYCMSTKNLRLTNSSTSAQNSPISQIFPISDCFLLSELLWSSFCTAWTR